MNWVHSDQKLSSSAIIIIYSDFEDSDQKLSSSAIIIIYSDFEGTNKNLIDETSEI